MSEWREVSQKKILDPSQLKERVEALRAEGKTVATLNGSFDLLHPGHLYILYEASKTADILLVALNSDASIQSNKGSSRPILSLDKRLEMLTAIAFVDYVTWFEESTPCTLLEKIQPDVHVNGAEYGENCIEADIVQKWGGRIHLVKRLPGLSTSELLACV